MTAHSLQNKLSTLTNNTITEKMLFINIRFVRMFFSSLLQIIIPVNFAIVHSKQTLSQDSVIYLQNNTREKSNSITEMILLI